jgi:DNA (cytosine-5)-methyltransferase 1
LKIGSLCTGYGGLDMAVEAYFDAQTVWVSEIDKPASQLIKARINKPNLGNLKIIDWANVEPIDIITAGYPCQPFSHAGNRKGADDERHLWPYIKTAISILRPRFVILENVRGHFGLGFGDVLSDLAHIGYNARWTLVRASDVGAPHRRERLFIIAYPDGKGLQRSSGSRYGFDQNPVEHSDTNSIGCSLVGNTSRKVRNKRQSQFKFDQLGKEIYNQAVPPALDQGKLNPVFVEYMMGLPKGWVTDVGLSRTQQLKILGNGVVPQQAYYALQLLLGQ